MQTEVDYVFGQISFEYCISIDSVATVIFVENLHFILLRAKKKVREKKNLKMSQIEIWSKETISSLINAIENEVLKTFPVTSINNNHEFTGNLLDIINDWNGIANQLNRSGELLNDKIIAMLT